MEESEENHHKNGDRSRSHANPSRCATSVFIPMNLANSQKVTQWLGKPESGESYTRLVSPMRENQGYPAQASQKSQPSADPSNCNWIFVIITLQPWVRTIQLFHLQVLKDSGSSFETISQGKSALDRPIVHWLQRYMDIEDRLLTKWHVSTIYSPTENHCSWPVVQWTENGDTQVIAIFQIDDDQCTNCLMHTGQIENGTWKTSALSWEVVDIDDLHTLVAAIVQMYGVLQWCPEDMVELYAGIMSQDASDEKYVSFISLTLRITRHARLIYLHYMQLRQLDSDFGKVAHLLQKLCPMEGKSHLCRPDL